jgi:cytochrome P450 family 110
MITSTERATGLPPGPDLSSRTVAQLWIEQPIEFWEECAARFGETFTIELGSLGTTILFSDPEAIRQIFQLAPESYEVRPFNDYYRSVMGDNALFLTDGPDHRRMRKVLMPPLHRRLVETHGAATRELVIELIGAWPAGKAFSPRPSLHLLSLRIILGVIFGSTDDPLAREIARMFSEEIYQHLGSWSVWTRFSRLHPRLRELIGATIRQRRSTAEGDSAGAPLFDALIRARDGAGELLSEEQIEDHLFTMFVAGVDPIALALSWALYWIHQDQEILARLRRDLADLGPDPAPDRVAALPYLDAACQETLRMYPIPSTPSGRKLLAPVEVDGRRYEPGITLLPCPYLVHRRADLYAEPARFRPERFLERQYGPHEYFPFGGGARTCIGAALVPLEMKLVLAEILNRCDLVPAHDGPVRPARHGTLLAPSDTMKFLLAGSPDSPGGEAP